MQQRVPLTDLDSRSLPRGEISLSNYHPYTHKNGEEQGLTTGLSVSKEVTDQEVLIQTDKDVWHHEIRQLNYKHFHCFGIQETTIFIRGAVCNFFNCTKALNTMIHLKIIRKHAKFNILVPPKKQHYSQLFYFENVHSVSECLFLFWAVCTHWQFTIIFCQSGLPENTA